MEAKGYQMKILKWPLNVTDRQTLKMPVGAKVLTVQMQGGIPCLWAMCESKETTERTILMYGTGNLMSPLPGAYIGTFQMGALVFHVFESM